MSIQLSSMEKKFLKKMCFVFRRGMLCIFQVEYNEQESSWGDICRPVEMKKFLGGATNYAKLSATMVDWRRKFFISNRLKRLEKQNLIFIWGSYCKLPSINSLLRNYFESVLKFSNFLMSTEVWSLGLKSLIIW